MGTTKFLSMRELRMSTSKINKILADDGTIIVTNNGKPAALMIGVDESSLERTLTELRGARVRLALDSMNKVAEDNGTAYITDEEINAEINAVRNKIRKKTDE